MVKKNNLDNVFNTDTVQIIETFKQLPIITIDAEDTKQQKEYVVNTFVDIIEKGKSVLNIAVTKLENSDTTQFDLKELSTVANLIHALSTANEKLNNTSKIDNKKQTSAEVVNNTQNNIVMQGTTEDVMNRIFNKEEK